jgi:hypothetical protein
MQLAEEIKRLSIENRTIPDYLSQKHVPFILKMLSKGVEAKLQCFETIQEGFNKVSIINSR